MTGFEFAKQFDTIEKKMIVMFMDAAKTAYKMAGMDFDSLPEQEKMDIIYKTMKRQGKFDFWQIVSDSLWVMMDILEEKTMPIG